MKWCFYCGFTSIPFSVGRQTMVIWFNQFKPLSFKYLCVLHCMQLCLIMVFNIWLVCEIFVLLKKHSFFSPQSQSDGSFVTQIPNKFSFCSKSKSKSVHRWEIVLHSIKIQKVWYPQKAIHFTLKFSSKKRTYNIWWD